MRITARGRYALRATLALATMGKNGEPVSINSIGERENISPVFLEQIFFKLRKAGIVSSVRGPGGGFTFARPPDEIPVKEILDAAGEEMEFTYCDKRSGECGRVGECLCHNVWADVTEIVQKYFAGITLTSILEKYGNEPAPKGPRGKKRG
jgi:Rrf2 family iron-sulfur cluster assembly transcriptional regulator